ncbi:ATP-binding protein [Halorientalis halophila]|uniref:sensor histidine kinase n=1 Tax=Halorientalis halophila TaxID=3108499 RepID=UPI0030084BF0
MVAFETLQSVAIAGSILVGLTCLVLAVRTVLVYDARGVRAFSLLLALVGLWSFNYVAKVWLPDLGPQLVVARIDFALTLLIPLLWFKFATDYVGKTGRTSRLVTELGGVVVFAATLAVVYVPEGTIWTTVRPVVAPYPHYVAVASPLYVGFAAVAAVLFLIGLLRLFEAVLTTRKGSLPIAILSMGTAIPLFFNAEYVLSLGLFSVNYTALGYGAFMIVAATTVFSNLFTVNPIARKTILANVTDGVLVLDHDHRVVDYNERFVETFTPTGTDLVGTPFAEAFPSLAEDLTLSDGVETVVERYDPSGTTYVRAAITRIDNGETTVGWNVVTTDVTTMKRQQAELRRQNEQLDQFASTVSHDLRNPLSVISGNQEIVSLELDDGREQAPAEGYAQVDADAVADRLATIDNATDRMETIIEDLLTLAREGQTVEEQAPVALSAVAADAWDVVDSKDATLSLDADGEIVANRSRLQTIFENLFRNAIDHVGPDVALRVTLDEDSFAVEDDGPGIPPEERDQVFEFGHTTSEDGSGLGLSIVKTMAEGHGWDVSIDFSYENGTRILFTGVTRDDSQSPPKAVPEPENTG